MMARKMFLSESLGIGSVNARRFSIAATFCTVVRHWGAWSIHTRHVCLLKNLYNICFILD